MTSRVIASDIILFHIKGVLRSFFSPPHIITYAKLASSGTQLVTALIIV